VTSREALAHLLWAEIKASGFRQVAVAAAAEITEKHLSQMLNGRCDVNPDIADRIFAACGRRLVLATEPFTEKEES
jgi:plasmid maintenance system antidote protein VapI